MAVTLTSPQVQIVANNNAAHPIGSQDSVVACLNCNQNIIVQPKVPHVVCGRCGYKWSVTGN